MASVPDELLSYLRQSLVLGSPTGPHAGMPKDAPRHSVVAFVTLEISGGELAVVSSELIHPRCCCGMVFCL